MQCQIYVSYVVLILRFEMKNAANKAGTALVYQSSKSSEANLSRPDKEIQVGGGQKPKQ